MNSHTSKQLFNKKFQTFALTSIITLTSAFTQPYNIVFDLTGPCFDYSKFKIARAGGLIDLDMIVYSVWERKNIKKVVFNFLEKEFGSQQAEEGCIDATGDGNNLPQIMCEWLAGRDGDEIIKTACAQVNDSEHLGSDRERRLAKKVLHTMFDAELLGNSFYPLKASAELLKKLKKSDENALYALTNQNDKVFNTLYSRKESNKIFKHFNKQNIIVSGDCKLIKPYHSIFHYTLESKDLDPKQTIFIDDQLENITEAKKCGMIALHFTGDFNKLEQELEDLGAL